MQNNFVLVNADTDSIMISKPDGKPWTKEEESSFLKSLNKQFPEKITWDHDGLFDRVLVIKSKNYVLLPQGENKIKTKGSALRDQKASKKIRAFKDELVQLLINEKTDELVNLYNKYAKEINDIQDIAPWCKKVGISSKILNCEGHEVYSKEEKKLKGIRANESKVYDALQGRKVQEGDKVYIFFKEDGTLSMVEDWSGDYSKDALFKLLFSSTKIFKNVLDVTQFPNYSLKKNKKVLEEMVNEQR